MLNKQFKNAAGEILKVEMVDDVNAQVYASINGCNHHWFLRREYDLWEKIPTVYIPDIPAQMVEDTVKEEADIVEEEVDKPKKTRKKKSDD